MTAVLTSAAPQGPKSVKPYGLLGLCLSTAAILLLSLIYSLFLSVICALLAMSIDRLVSGCWCHTTDFLLKLKEDGGFPAGSPLLQQLLFAGSIVVYVGLSLAILTFARLRGGRAWRVLVAWQPWSPLKAGRAYWLIAAAGLAGGLAIDILIGNLYPPSKDWFVVPKDDLLAAGLLFAMAAVFAPLTEELLFRGWIYTSLRASFGRWIAIVVSALVFAAAHHEQTHIYALAVFPIGLALGGMREVTGSLKASISFHAFYNALAFSLAVLDIG